MEQAATLGALRASGYRPRPVHVEMRENLLARLRGGERVFEGIVGYEDSVLPAIENAILAGHDLIFLGERGQAKSRIMRTLVGLLDEAVPAVAGCEINDDPLAPICTACRELIGERGDETPIAWLGPEDRYGEKLATPDISVADLIGEVDPIKVAEGRYLADELTIHFGLIPRTHRGIFAINELPDLAERIQVALLNLLEERDIQIRGYKIRLPLDIVLLASANPEDYTNRGRIITPLKDRFGAQVRTHYPRTAAEEAEIVRREAQVPDDVRFPEWMSEIVAEVTHQARRSGQINQRSGVSVRLSIANQETVAASALRRAVRLGEPEAVPRISDLEAMASSTLGKIEVEALEEGREDDILTKLVRQAVQAVYQRRMRGQTFPDLVRRFEEEGLEVQTGVGMGAEELCRQFGELKGMAQALQSLGAGESPATTAAALEFICEGLHLGRRLNKTPTGSGAVYGG
ncbi:MAG TPA: magnesium chelatase [Actinomycetota bacterium]|nr:magnesium chelatase [Actinomycetota bacterium]